MIELEDITKTFKVPVRTTGFKAAAKSLFKREYRVTRALDGISFKIGDGEIVGYIGPNGAGKSTTVKVMSGILVPDRGTCVINGLVPWRDRISHVQKIGVVFGQRSQLWWDVPVIDSFELLKDIYKIPNPEYANNLDMLVDTLDISGITGIPVRQLSLGQRMRCEIAASLLHGPDILFLDEPTIGLDAVSKMAVRQFIRKVNKEKKVTVILTTHDMNDIEALAGRILLIGKGRILYDGDIGGIRSRFGTIKTITVDHAESGFVPMTPGLKVISLSHERACLSVDTKETGISDIIAYLSGMFEIKDVTVENPPIEDIIVHLYKEYEI